MAEEPLNIAARLDQILRNAGHAITGVSIGDRSNKATWTVSPSSLQVSCQATIDGFDPLDPAHAAAEKAAERDRQLAAKALRALATAIHKRFKAQVATDPTTAAQWEASLLAEWDALP